MACAFTIIMLLYGQLKIDFVQEGDVKSTALHFGTVNEDMYSAPIEYILDSIDGQENVAVNAEQCTSAILDDWPMKLQNLSALYLSKKSQLLDGIWWDEMRGGFGREFGPTAAVPGSHMHGHKVSACGNLSTLRAY